MTPKLIQELEALKTRFTDEEDATVLSTLLRCEEAARNREQEIEEEQASCCGAYWAASLLDENNRCPWCKLEWMHDFFERRRREAYIQGR